MRVDGATGRVDQHTLSGWIKQFEDLLDALPAPYDEAKKINVLHYMLTGKARKVLEKVPAADKDSHRRTKTFFTHHLESPEIRDIANSVLTTTRQTRRTCGKMCNETGNSKVRVRKRIALTLS